MWPLIFTWEIHFFHCKVCLLNFLDMGLYYVYVVNFSDQDYFVRHEGCTPLHSLSAWTLAPCISSILTSHSEGTFRTFRFRLSSLHVTGALRWLDIDCDIMDISDQTWRIPFTWRMQQLKLNRTFWMNLQNPTKQATVRSWRVQIRPLVFSTSLASNAANFGSAWHKEFSPAISFWCHQQLQVSMCGELESIETLP